MTDQQHLCILSPHFVPGNVTSVHRTRLWSQHIEEFGWKLSVVTTDSEFYEEPIDESLNDTLDPNIDVYQCKALPVKPIRWVGDIGIRSLPYYVSEISKLHKQCKIDFLHIAIPSNFASLVGRIIWLKHKIPYGVDYIDPWVHDSEENQRVLSKAWLSNQLAKLLEPWVVNRASLITGICRQYYDGMLRRNPAVESNAVLSDMPYGLGERDYINAAKLSQEQLLFDKSDGFINLVYAGALLPHGRVLLREFMHSLSIIKSRDPESFKRTRIYFIGTALADQSLIEPLAEEFDVIGNVFETRSRMSYLLVLKHLMESDVCLVLGGSDKKYNPSKIFQTIASGNPVLTILNESSPALATLPQVDACHLLTFATDGAGLSDQIASKMSVLIKQAIDQRASLPRRLSNPTSSFRHKNALFTARDSSRKLATALDKAMSRQSVAKK